MGPLVGHRRRLGYEATVRGPGSALVVITIYNEPWPELEATLAAVLRNLPEWRRRYGPTAAPRRREAYDGIVGLTPHRGSAPVAPLRHRERGDQAAWADGQGRRRHRSSRGWPSWWSRTAGPTAGPGHCPGHLVVALNSPPAGDEVLHHTPQVGWGPRGSDRVDGSVYAHLGRCGMLDPTAMRRGPGPDRGRGPLPLKTPHTPAPSLPCLCWCVVDFIYAFPFFHRFPIRCLPWFGPPRSLGGGGLGPPIPLVPGPGAPTPSSCTRTTAECATATRPWTSAPFTAFSPSRAPTPASSTPTRWPPPLTLCGAPAVGVVRPGSGRHHPRCFTSRGPRPRGVGVPSAL